MSIIIRQALAQDAPAVLEHVHAVVAQSEHIPKSPDEVTLTLEEEKKALQWYRDQENCLFLIALDGDKVIGNLDLKGYPRKAMQHMAELGIAIQAAYQRQGLGFTLLDEALGWARENPMLQRINLQVYEDNLPAVKLYEKFGFKHEGRREKYIFQNGRYHTDLLMGLWVGN